MLDVAAPLSTPTHSNSGNQLANTRLQKEDSMAQTLATQQGSKQASDKNAIRPFQVTVPEADLTELRRRINATKWPERETVTDGFWASRPGA